MQSNFFLKKVKRAIVKLLFEEKCVNCGKSVSQNPFFCDRCLFSLRPIPEEDLTSIPYLDGYRTFTRYGPLEEKIIHLIKSEGVKSLAHHVGKLAAPLLEEYAKAVKADIVGFVPTNPWRLWFVRGFEPVWEMAKPANLKVERVIKRRFLPRKPLYLAKDPKERKKLVKGVYTIGKEVEGKTLLVIDDLLTSGATASEIAYVAKAAKASRVYLFAFFRA